MDLGNRCDCGRLFAQPSALVKHRRTCQKAKKRLSSALDKAKQAWTGRKQRRLDIADPPASPTASALRPMVQRPLGAADPQPALATAGLVYVSEPSSVMQLEDTSQVRHSSYVNMGNLIYTWLTCR
jgi:hypothetical protein